MRFWLGYASLAVYAASFASYVAYLYSSHRWVGRLATLLLAGGIVLQYAALYERARIIHAVPYDDLYGSMSLFAWLLAVTYLALETYHRQRSVGAFVTLLLIVWIAIVSAVIPVNEPAHPSASGPLFALHVTLNTLAYSAFALSFALSLIYLFQERVLRARKPGAAFWRFPALDLLEKMSRSSVWVGLCSLCLGVSLGFVWQHRLFGNLALGDPKVIITVIIFGMYAVYLWLARQSAWRGPRAALFCACSFVVVLFSYTFVNFYLTRFHRFY